MALIAVDHGLSHNQTRPLLDNLRYERCRVSRGSRVHIRGPLSLDLIQRAGTGRCQFSYPFGIDCMLSVKATSAGFVLLTVAHLSVPACEARR